MKSKLIGWVKVVSTFKVIKRSNDQVSTMISTTSKKAAIAGVFTLLAAVAIFVIDDEFSSLRGGFIAIQSKSRRRAKHGRGLSLELGGGNCEWKEPLAAVPAEIDFYKTLLAGFPSGWVATCDCWFCWNFPADESSSFNEFFSSGVGTRGWRTC